VVLKGAVRPDAITVPQRAVLEGPQGKFVYVVNAESKVEARPVEAGQWSGDEWIITKGLKAGERVVTDGVMKLGPGAPVRIAEAGQAQGQGQGQKPPAQGQKPPAKK
jgi:membrane fusion protein (multidrug efflux system)